MLPPRTVQPKPAGQEEVESKRLPADINRLLQPRAGYKTSSSRSGQFVAYGPMSPKRRGGIFDANANTILIAPDYVIVTAERVRHAMLGRLGLPPLPGDDAPRSPEGEGAALDLSRPLLWSPLRWDWETCWSQIRVL